MSPANPGVFIPINVWLSHDLTWNEKLLLGLIINLRDKVGMCWHGNDAIAARFLDGSRSPRTIANGITQLRAKGFVFFMQSKRPERCLAVNCEKCFGREAA